MPKPRRKVGKKSRADLPVNPQIQKLLDMQSEKKRYASWADTDTEPEWDDTVLCPAAEGGVCEGPCGNAECANYTLALNPLFEAPKGTILLEGLPANTSGKRWAFDIDGGPENWGIVAGDRTIYPDFAIELYDWYYLVHFKYRMDREYILAHTLLRHGPGLFRALRMPPTSKALSSKLDEMDDLDHSGAVEELESDPVVAAALVPGLRRSDFTQPVNAKVFRGLTDPSTKARMLEYLS